MQTSESINELATALAKAQATISGASKDAVNPHFRAYYATLASVWEAWQKVGPAQGLALMQVTEVRDGVTYLVTRLSHTSGQWIEGVYLVKPTRDDPQQLGSALTYARRYSLAAMVGIAPEDDDGNAASEKPKAPAKPVQAAPPAPKPETPKAKSPQALAAEWVAKAKQDIADMVSVDDVDAFIRDNARFVESLGKYPELEAEFDQFVKHAINSKPSSLEAA